jgi:hypothetical protein
MDAITRSVIVRTLDAIRATRLPAEVEQRLLQEIQARFGELPDAGGGG